MSFTHSSLKCILFNLLIFLYFLNKERKNLHPNTRTSRHSNGNEKDAQLLNSKLKTE